MKQYTNIIKLLALALVLVGITASCGSSKRCDCPSFSEKTISEKAHV